MWTCSPVSGCATLVPVGTPVLVLAVVRSMSDLDDVSAKYLATSEFVDPIRLSAGREGRKGKEY